jgi:hypothetical protein
MKNTNTSQRYRWLLDDSGAAGRFGAFIGSILFHDAIQPQAIIANITSHVALSLTAKETGSLPNWPRLAKIEYLVAQ